MIYSKLRHEQLIFMIGLPGSGWSKMDNLLRCCSKFKANKSDYEGRWESYGNNRLYREHKGAFWDPGMEFGEGFDNLEKNHTKDSFIKECLRPFTDINDQNYLIRSHFFAESKNLAWLTKNFPNNKLIFVLRDTRLCWEGWTTSMTFTGRYPSYKAWMKISFIDDHPDNYSNMWGMMLRHDKMIREFVRDNDCLIIQPHKTFLNLLGYIWDDEGKEEYDKLIMVHQFFKSEVPMLDAPFVFYNCNDIFKIQS